MADPSDAGQSFAALIPEFYYDIIGRVVPGILIVCLYLPCDVKAGELETTLLLLIFSYFLGLTLDVVSDRIFYFIHFLLDEKWSVLPKFLKVETDGKLWDWTRTLRRSDQLPLKKMFAEKAIFRIGTFVALISTAIPPPALQEGPHRIVTSLAATCVFLLCLHGMYRWMEFVKNGQEKAQSAHVSTKK